MNNIELLKIGNIAGMFYHPEITPQKKLVIYGLGAPIPPDNGTLPDAQVIIDHGYDIFVPDYLGYGRSDGVFTPHNCIQTFLDLYKDFSTGCIAKNFYAKKEYVLHYSQLVFIGRSFAAAYIPLLPRFNSAIKQLAIVSPVVNSKVCGLIKGEESNDDFLGSMKHDGYHYLYRGVLNQVWKDHLENKDDLSPMDNIQFLADAQLFIGHGKLDQCVHYSRSVEYYQKILEKFPAKKNNFRLNLYSHGDHGKTTTSRAVDDFLSWLTLG